jgi:hypothetical protein
LFLGFGGVFVYFGSVEWPGIAVFMSLVGLFIPTIFGPYMYWQFRCQHVNVSTSELIRLFGEEPLCKDSQHLISELGERGSDAVAAAPRMIKVFHKCFDTPMPDLLDRNLRFSIAKALVQMGRAHDATEAVVDYLKPARMGDLKDGRYSRSAFLIRDGLHYLEYIGPEAQTALPLLKQLAGKGSWLPDYLRKDALKSLHALESKATPRWKPV